MKRELYTKFKFEKRDLVLSAAFFVTTLAIFIKSSFIVSWDLSQYLVIAENLNLKGEMLNSSGQIEAIRIGFIYFLALLLRVSGDTLHIVHYSIASVSALTIPLTYILGSIIKNRVVGFLAAFLALTSPEIIKWAPRHIDAFWTVFLLVSMILLLYGRSANMTKGIFAGTAAAFAIFIKPVAVLFLFFPILYRVRVQKKSYIREFFFYIAIVVLLLLLQQWTNEFDSLNKVQSESFYLPFSLLENPQVFQGASDFIFCSLYGLFGYFFLTDRGGGLLSNFPFALILLIAAIAVGIKGGIKRDNNFSLFVALIVFFPFLSLCGLYDLRLPQFLLGYILGFIAISAVVVSILNLASRKLRFSSTIKWLILIPILAGLTVFSNWSSKSRPQVIYKNTLLGSQFTKKGFQNEIVLRGGQLHEWLAENINSNDAVMISDIPSANGTYLKGKGSFPVFYLPYAVIGDEITVSYFSPLVPVRTGAYFVNLFGLPKSPQSAILVLNSEILFEFMEQNMIQFLAVSNREKDLMQFIDALPWLEIETTVKDFHSFSIYRKVKNIVNTDEDSVHFTKKALLFLEHLNEKKPHRHQWFLDKLDL